MSPGAMRQTIRQFIMFNMIGLVNTAVDFMVFSLLVWLGVYFVGAQVISYGAGIVNSYVMNSWLTFGKGPEQRRERKFDKAQAIRFTILSCTVLGLSLPLLYFVSEKMLVNEWLAKLLVTGVTTVLNFIGSKKWVFRGK